MVFNYQTAGKAELEAEFKRIASITGDDRFFTKKEFAHLPSVLASTEQPLAACSGFMDGNTWLIVLTDRRIIFLDKGMIYGLRQVSIDLDKVNAVSGKTGLIFGEVHIEDGASTRSIQNLAKGTVIPFTNLVRDAIERRKRPQAVPGGSGDDVVTKLERLAALRDRGVITEAEFTAQKERILAA